ncbi:MAG TPA: signal peptidase I [Nitrospirota bacterium]|nr:signal peptidase I [Nitrospirota bacterium]
MRKKSFYKEWIEPFLIAAVVALFIRQFVVEAFKIPSGSMIPTLKIGDHLLVNKFVYGPRIPFTDTRFFSWQEPKRGDVIVFKFPVDENKDFIKRVVGLPGDKIEIKNGVLMVNDQPVKLLEESAPGRAAQTSESEAGFQPKFYKEQLGPVTHDIQYLHDQSGASFGPVVVPKESVFVMGDNRDNSQDSRVWGFVKFNKILGRALIIYWSWNGETSWVRWNRIGSLIR